MTNSAPTIDTLLNLVPDAAGSVLNQLRVHPQLASKQDGHGYSLLHAAASYEQLDLLKALVQDFHVDPNLTDEDGETCLFNVESVAFAQEVIKLGVNIDAQNSDGQTAAEKLDDEDEQPDVAVYLRDVLRERDDAPTSPAGVNGTFDYESVAASANVADQDMRPPPPLPNGVQVSIGAMHADDVGEEPDPEFRRRIEELAARTDFQGEEGQSALRDLVTDAVSGLNNSGQGPATRRRVG